MTQIANEIRYLLDEYDQIIPAILEIPSKDAPYDPSKGIVFYACVLRVHN